MASNQLLLRLFHSEFFNSWIALSYLLRYPDNLGIQHYLCDRLWEFPYDEILFFLPQLCHLLITRPSRSVAVESFLLQWCRSSPHIAILMLWYLQAYMADLATRPTTESYRICKRMLTRCQDAIIAEPDAPLSPPPSPPLRLLPSGPSRRPLDLLRRLMGSKKRVGEHLGPALVGITAIMAATAGPVLMAPAGRWALAQGMRERTGDEENEEEDGGALPIEATSSTSSDLLPLALAPPPPSSRQADHTSDLPIGRTPSLTSSSSPPPSAALTLAGVTDGAATDDDALSPPAPTTPPSWHARRRISTPSSILPTASPTLEQLHRGSAFASPRRAATSSSTDPSSRLSTLSSGDTLIPLDTKGRGGAHHFHSEMQFLLALMEVSSRLVDVPKPARQSSLLAELSLLNHNLPADICIPLWCPASSSHPNHHRVVRIASSDSVVLNSADRVPFLLMLEVVETPEFPSPLSDPEEESSIPLGLGGVGRRRSASTQALSDARHGPSPSSSETSLHRHLPPPPITADAFLEIDEEDTDELFGGAYFKKKKQLAKSKAEGKTSTSSTLFEEAEEGQERDNTTVTDTKQEDISTDIPPSSDIHNVHRSSRSIDQRRGHSAAASTSSLISLSSTANPPSSVEYHRSVRARRNSAAQDEFSERMRTAAVMLAQLARASGGGGMEVPGTFSKDASLSSSTPSSTNNPSASSAGTNPGNTSGGISSGHVAGAGAVGGAKTAAAMANAAAIRERIIREMHALEEQRMQRIRLEGVGSGVGGSGGEGGGGEALEHESRVLDAVKKGMDDPSAAVLKESWTLKRERIRTSSPYGQDPTWDLLSVIVKTNADLRQEQLALQLISEMQRIWRVANIPVYVNVFRILVTSDSTGLIETIKDSVSVHSLKNDGYARQLNQRGLVYTLYDHFVNEFGEPDSPEFKTAQTNFVQSLAAYSVVTYLLQLKDRHNGNVLLDTKGHIIHIDFGFMLSNSPGAVAFEAAPFKLPQEYLDVMGGVDSEAFADFKSLVKRAFIAVRKSGENLVLLIEMMQKDSKLPCFISGENASAALRERFQPTLNESQVEDFVERLIISSCCNVFTRLYDTFQYYSNGIL